MAYINRAIEDTLKNRFKTAKSIAITGARQVGKTTILEHIDKEKMYYMQGDMGLYFSI